MEESCFGSEGDKVERRGRRISEYLLQDCADLWDNPMGLSRSAWVPLLIVEVSDPSPIILFVIQESEEMSCDGCR